MTTPLQPILPAPVPLTDAEFNFIEESPPNLLVENQDSNIGFIRKIFSDRIMEAVLQMNTMYNERFPQTSTQFLEMWEYEVGVATDETKDILQRQTTILSRLQQTAFTREGRKNIIEQFIQATFGTPTSFGPSGIPITPGGITLYSGQEDISTLYRIVEDISNFSYDVRIKNTVAPDESSLRRALDRFTPAGISYTISYVATP